MCLYVNTKQTTALRRRMSRKKSRTIKVYKVLTVALQSPYYAHIWKPGWNRSNRRKTQVNRPRDMINQGIHVFLRRDNDAMKSFVSAFYTTPIIVLPVTAHLADLVAADNWDGAVFTKVFVQQTDYEAAVANCK